MLKNINEKKLISLSASKKAAFVAYSVSEPLGILDILTFSEPKKEYFLINIFSSDELPPYPVLLDEVLRLVEEKEKYQDNRLKHGFKYSILPLVKYPKLGFRIKNLTKTDFELLEDKQPKETN